MSLLWVLLFAGPSRAALGQTGSAASDPTLRIELTAQGPRLQWPVAATPARLESTATLSPASWQSYGSADASVNELLLTNATEGARFFRLVRAANDEPDIRALLAAMKSRAEAHDSSGFTALFASDYLHTTETLAGLVADVQQVVPTIRTFDFDVSRIEVAEGFAKVYGTVTIVRNNGEPPFVFQEPCLDDRSPGFGFLKKTPEGWRVHGNQARAGAWISTAYSGTGHSLRIRAESPFPVSQVRVSGPGIVATTLAPDAQWGGFTGWATPSPLPSVGAVYTFEVQFADGVRQSLTAAILSFVTQTPDPIRVTPGSGSATITWTNILPSIAGAQGYWVWVYDSEGHSWMSDDDDYLTQNSLTVNQAMLGFPLLSGKRYEAQVFLFDEFDDYSNSTVSFTMP